MSSIDWTTVIVALINMGGIVFVGVYTARIHKGAKHLIEQTKIPSGDTLGEIVERTHDLTAANTAMLQQINGGLAKEVT